MAVQPTSILNIQLECLRAMLAHCESFQNWTQSRGNSDLAKTHVYPVNAPSPSTASYTEKELSNLRPLAVVNYFMPPSGIGGLAWVARKNSEVSYVSSGKLFLDFEDDLTEEEQSNPGDAQMHFMNDVGKVIEELLDLSCRSDDFMTAEELNAGLGGLSITSLEIYSGPGRTDEAKVQTEGDHYGIRILLQWGI